MWFEKSFITKFLLKAAIYMSLIVIVYFYQILEVVNKYKENLTNIAHSEKIMKNGIKPPVPASIWSTETKSPGSFACEPISPI